MDWWSENVFNGSAGTFSPGALDALRQQPEVAGSKKVRLPPSLVSQPSWSSNLVTSTDIEMHTTVLVQQTNAPWGLACLSSGSTPLANKDPNALSFQYTFDDSAGGGTDAFILDTGCRVTHQEFGGRALQLNLAQTAMDVSTTQR